MTSAIGIHVAPTQDSAWANHAVIKGGGRPCGADEARGIVWATSGDAEHLAAALALAPHAEWIHTAYAGVDAFVHLLDRRWTWTSGKGALAEPVAEHALSLTLSALRHVPALSRIHSWCEIEPRTLFGATVVVVGAGAVAAALATLLEPFKCNVQLLARRDTEWSQSPTGRAKLGEHALSAADVVVLAAPLTDATRGIIASRELRLMSRSAVLVNIGRGGLVETDDLLEALDLEEIHFAALDVTDPEPLPDGHRLYSHPRCVVTCHTAVTEASGRDLLAPRISENVARFLRGDALLGVIDPDLHY